MFFESAIKLLIVFIIYSEMRCEYVHFGYCGGVNSIINVHLEPCTATFMERKKLLCALKQGTEVEFEFVFIPPYNSSRVMSKAVATFNGKNIKLPDFKSNPCKASLYPKCPLIERELYSFSRLYNLTDDVPKGPVKIKLTLRDKETKSMLACARTLVYVV